MHVAKTKALEQQKHDTSGDTMRNMHIYYTLNLNKDLKNAYFFTNCSLQTWKKLWSEVNPKL